LATSATACAYCATGYYLSGGACVATTPNCEVSYKDTGKCQTCSTGFTMYEGVCVPNTNVVANADEYDTGTLTLLSCASGFYMDTPSTCAAVTAICATASYNTNRCQTCTSPKVLFNNACVNQAVTNCAKFGTDGNCQYCEPGFYLSAANVCAAQTATPASCATYTFNANACETCSAATQSYTKCSTTLANCQLPSADAVTCVVCVAGYYLTTTNSCAAQSLPNCQTYLRNFNVCTACNTGYTLTQFACRPSADPDKSPNCLVYAASVNTCYECKTGFGLNTSGVCVTGTVLNCAEFTTSSICRACNTGYTLVLNLCVLNAWITSYCSKYSLPNYICTNCWTYTTLSAYSSGMGITRYTCYTSYTGGMGGGMTGGMGGGTYYYPPGTTTQTNCLSGQTSTLCSVCKQTFYMNFVTQTCVGTARGCLTNVDNVDYCKTCSGGSAVMAGRCVSGTAAINNCLFRDSATTCLVCRDGYFLNTARTACTLQTLPASCSALFQNIPWACQTCSAGTPINGACVTAPVANCVYYATTGACQLCDSLFYLSGGACLPVTDPDMSANWPNQNVIRTCAAGTLVNSMCVPAPIPNCLKYLSKTACEVCGYGFYLAAGACVAITDPNCTKNFLNTDDCRTCRTTPAYTLFRNRCVLTSVYQANCVVYNTAYTACVVCAQGYYLSGGVCTAGTVSGCTRYWMNTGFCRACSSGTPFKTVCIPAANVAADCADYNVSTLKCVACRTGFYLTATSACQSTASPVAVANCVSYDFNTQRCKGCEPGYELHDGGCISTTGPSLQSSCLMYSPATQKCLFCDNTHHLAADGTACLANTVASCSTYLTNANTCVTCSNGQLPDNNLCVPPSDPNCLDFDSGVQSCNFCVDTHFVDLATGVCTPGTVANCQAFFAKADFCDTCAAVHTLFDNTCLPDAAIVANCVRYVSNACTRCRQGYFLSGAACVQTPAVANCLYYDATSSSCAVCATGVLYDNRCLPARPNCVRYDVATHDCLACGPGFFASGGACATSSVPNCSAYLFNLNVCQTCQPGYTLWDTTCVPDASMVVGCLAYSGPTCALCDRGYYLNGGSCVASVIPNCQTFLHNLQRCQSCANGFTLWNNNCVAHPDVNCVEYDPSTGYCQFCASSYFWNPATSACELGSVPNCVHFLPTKDLCQECGSGFVLADGYCVAQADSNCAQYSAGTCVYCLAGYYLSGAACVAGTVASCARYAQSSNTCVQCASGSLYNNLCVSALIANCLEYDPAVTTCRSCAPGFYLSGAACAAGSVPDCQTYWYNTNVCQTCRSGFTLWKQLCVPNAQYSPQCVSYSGQGVCLMCTAGFVLNAAGTCSRSSVPNCVAYLYNRPTCTACAGSLFLWKNGCVVRDDNCLEFDLATRSCRFCKQGFYFDVNTLRCTAGPVANCQVYRWNSPTCLVCAVGSPVNNVCLPANGGDPNCGYYESGTCTRCNDGYFLDAGTCRPGTKSNCRVYSAAADLCVVCSSGVAYRGDCVPSLIPRCTAYTDSTYSTCRACERNLQLSSNACVGATGVANCFNYHFTSSVCKLCAAGYTLWGRLCLPDANLVSNCAVYDPATLKCVFCVSGYRFDPSSGRCMQMSQPVRDCTKYHLNSYQCRDCASGTHVRWNTQCVPVGSVVADCLDYFSGSCVRCPAGKYLAGSVCQTGSQANCQVYMGTSDTCQVCSPGFGFWGDQCMDTSAADPNCLDFVNGACRQCRLGYYTSGGATCLQGTVANCRLYLPSVNACARCQDTFFLWSNNCYPQDKRVSGCTQYDAGTQTCAFCGPTSVRTASGSCSSFPAPANCAATRLDSPLCSRCNSGHNLINGLCVPAASSDPNCVQLGLTNSCNYCAPLYVLQNGRCVLSSLANCASNVVNTARCQKCLPGFTLTGSECVPTGSDPKCESFTDPTGATCSFCSTGYYLSGGSCTAVDVPNCVRYTPNTNACLACGPGFALGEGQCALSNSGCATLSLARDTCLGCKSGFILDSGRCSAGPDPNCDVYDSASGLCSKCLAGFNLISGKCVVPIAGCSGYSSDGLACASCGGGLALVSSLSCARPVLNCDQYTKDGSACVNCKAAFSLVLGACRVNVPNCRAFASDGSACIDCNDFYYLAQSKCVPTTVPNCAIFLPSTNVCSACFFHYRLENNQCVWDSPCRRFKSDQNTCVECVDGFTLVDNSCVKPVKNCQRYSEDGLLCETCERDFRLQEGVCVFAAGCRVVDEMSPTGACLECVPQFYLIDGLCVPQDVGGCSLYRPGTNRCLKCEGGLVEFEGCCVENVPQCWTYDCDSGACEVCKDDFYLTGGQCLRQAIPNCVQYEANVNECRVCRTGFVNNIAACVKRS
jgi:hypothetical protein